MTKFVPLRSLDEAHAEVVRAAEWAKASGFVNVARQLERAAVVIGAEVQKANRLRDAAQEMQRKLNT